MEKEVLKQKLGIDVVSYIKLKENVYLHRLKNKEEVIIKLPKYFWSLFRS